MLAHWYLVGLFDAAGSPPPPPPAPASSGGGKGDNADDSPPGWAFDGYKSFRPRHPTKREAQAKHSEERPSEPTPAPMPVATPAPIQAYLPSALELKAQGPEDGGLAVQLKLSAAQAAQAARVAEERSAQDEADEIEALMLMALVV